MPRTVEIGGKQYHNDIEGAYPFRGIEVEEGRFEIEIAPVTSEVDKVFIPALCEACSLCEDGENILRSPEILQEALADCTGYQIRNGCDTFQATLTLGSLLVEGVSHEDRGVVVANIAVCGFNPAKHTFPL